MLQATIVSLVSWGLGGQFVALLCGHWCLGAVGVAGADGGRHASRVAGSVDVSHGDDGGEIAVGVVRAGSGRDSGRVHTSRPLAPGGLIELLLLPEKLLLPPLTGSWDSRQSGRPLADMVSLLLLPSQLVQQELGTTRNIQDLSLPLANMVGIDLLLLPDDMVLEVLGTTGNVKDLSLPLADVMSNLSGMGNLGTPPSISGRGSRHLSGVGNLGSKDIAFGVEIRVSLTSRMTYLCPC